MRIFIIGPSGSGKTFLASKLSQKLQHKHISLDYIFYKHVKDKNRVELSEHEWRKEISRLMKQKDWVIEGVNPVKEILDNADKILYLRSSFLTSIFSQWFRYFTDTKQRREHGFINNLKLSKYLVKQYFQEPDSNEMNNPKYSRVKKIDNLLENYKGKSIIFKSRNTINRFLKTENLS